MPGFYSLNGERSYRKISKPRNWVLTWSYRSKMLQTPWQGWNSLLQNHNKTQLCVCVCAWAMWRNILKLNNRDGGLRRNMGCYQTLTRYVKWRVAHAPGMPGTFSPPPTSNETASWLSRHASRHVRHERAVMHVGMAHPRWRGKRSRHSRRMRNLRFDVSGKRPMGSAEINWNNGCRLVKVYYSYDWTQGCLT